MRKKIWILAALCLVLCMPVLRPEGLSIVRAKEQDANRKEERVGVRSLSTRGNMVYQDDGKRAGIYVSDFSLLYEKLSMVSGEIFDPARYTHIHQWEYRDLDSRTHTRHCAICGDAFDLVDAHKAESEDACTIFYEGREFPGRCYSCACGYRWEREEAHVLTFDMADEICHRSRCLLDGSEYCLGHEPVEEEHYAFYRTPDQMGTSYIKTCIDCGYQTQEAYEPEEIVGEFDGETETPEPGEMPGEIGEETVLSEPDKQPEMTVSGNDCAVNEMQNEPEEPATESVD